MTCHGTRLSPPASATGRVFTAPATAAALLASIPAPLRARPVYAYIVTSIKTSPELRLYQTGSAPNFDGGRITLCTCKHKDRATFHLSNDPEDPWKNVWVAGLTSRSEDPSRALAYLMFVERSFSSQVELWHSLPAACRQAKSASRSEHGDLFEPKAAAAKDPYNPASYHAPHPGDHVHATQKHPSQWHRDVMRWGRWSKPHRLLLGQVAQSYRWPRVTMILKLGAMGISAHHRQYSSLAEFITNLQEFDP
jgi:hypothetical protein